MFFPLKRIYILILFNWIILLACSIILVASIDRYEVLMMKTN